MSEFYCSEIPEKSKRGRKPDPNKLLFKTLGGRQWLWDLLAKFQTEQERIEGNFTPAFERAMEHLSLFAPNGPDAAKPRDPKTGRWIAGNGTSKSAIARRNKRERLERELAELDDEHERQNAEARQLIEE